MNHPFFHIPAYYKEVLVIGDKEEVYKAECTIYNFLREEKTNHWQKDMNGETNVYTLSILIPFTIHSDEYNEQVNKIKEKYTVDVQTYDPIPPRKHATAMIVGTWENISLAKDMMVKWIETKSEIKHNSWNDYEKFEKMILNQQIRFTYKSLKRFIIEKHVKYLKHWDLTSQTVIRELPQEPTDKNDKDANAFYKLAKSETESLKYFMKHVDNETAINVLFATNNDDEFGKLMGKYDLSKREIIEKSYKLLVDNMEEYNFMGSNSRYYDSYHHGHNYYEGSSGYNRYQRSSDHYYDNRKGYGSHYHSDYKYKDYGDKYEGDRNQESKHEDVQERPDEQAERDKQRDASRSDYHNYRSRENPPGYYDRHSSRDKYDYRSRHYSNSDYKYGYSSSYKDRRSSYKRSSHHRTSSSRRRSRSKHHNR